MQPAAKQCKMKKTYKPSPEPQRCEGKSPSARPQLKSLIKDLDLLAGTAIPIQLQELNKNFNRKYPGAGC